MYNKIFTKILDSSIWLEPTGTRIVWLTLLAAMDQDGFAQFASPQNLAHRARVEAADCEAALRCLEGPDSNSGDPDNEGRRIERVPGGWFILNAAKYRDIVTRVVDREQNRLRVARHREKQKSVTVCNGTVMEGNGHVTTCTDLKRSVTPSDTYTEAYSEAHKSSASGDTHKAEEGKEVKPDPIPKTTQRLAAARPALTLMRELSGRPFREVDSNLLPIAARLEEPEVTQEGVLQMLRREWENRRGDPEQEKWYQPQTIFRAKNFDGYYSARELPARARKEPEEPAWRQTQRVEDAIAVHPANREWVGYRAENVTEADREAFRNLKLQRAKLIGVK